MNCIDCDAHREDLQTGDHYCRDLGVMLSPGAVECPRQQVREPDMERSGEKPLTTYAGNIRE